MASDRDLNMHSTSVAQAENETAQPQPGPDAKLSKEIIIQMMVDRLQPRDVAEDSDDENDDEKF